MARWFRRVAWVGAFLAGVAFAQVGVTPGTNGWIYLNEEFLFGNDEKPGDIADTLAMVKGVGALLKRRGIRLAVALVPTKARTYPQFLPPGVASSPVIASRYRRALDALQAAGIVAPDLAAAFKSSRLGTGDFPLFIRLGSHWSTPGALQAAESLAAALWAAGLRPAVPAVKYALKWLDPVPSPDSLLKALGQDAPGALPPESYRPLEVTRVTPEPGGLLGPEVVPAVTLVGTSYSEAAWNFPGALRYALQADVLDVSQPGKNIWAPMSDYVTSDRYQATPPKVLVWEIPERYLLTPPGGPRGGGTSWLVDVAAAPILGACAKPLTGATLKVSSGLQARGLDATAGATDAKSVLNFRFAKPTGLADYLSVMVRSTAPSFTLDLDDGRGPGKATPVRVAVEPDGAWHRVNVVLMTQTGRGYAGLRLLPGATQGFGVRDFRVCAMPQP
ncbi:MAG TPA: hypothetical protein VHN99_03195 [Deinococcales bacterium]|nr:hypothetical protein [Deinococcales bacterium]